MEKVQFCLTSLTRNIANHYADYFYILTGTFFGGIFGVLMTLFIMTTLTMLSSSGIFNLYYGGLLGFLGAFLILRVYRKNKLVELDTNASVKKTEGMFTNQLACNDSIMLS
jgi:hypothetical protein